MAADNHALRAAIREVITPNRMKILVGMLLRAAIEKQDVHAARILVERALGRPRAEPPQQVALDLPEGLKTAEEVATAANALVKAIARGRLAPEDARQAAAIVEVARKAIETQDLERRIAELEEHAKKEKRR